MVKHFFLPHPDTHKKAHLLSWKAILVYIILFFCLRFGVEAYGLSYPGVLGISSQVDQKELIELTNQERFRYGLTNLSENEKLDQAALEKAKNMFAEDYWAHYAPSGKTPWDFIQRSAYRYSYAGENLARNFTDSQEVVSAWMASPTHKENILNNRYQEIGIAVLEGVLKGQKTTLVVQMFGTPVDAIALNPVDNQKNTFNAPKVAVETADNTASLQGVSAKSILINPVEIYKSAGLALIILVGFLIMVDLYVLKKKAVVRISSRHLPHLAFLGVATSMLVSLRSGSIL